MLADEVWIRTDDATENERDEHGVVELPRHGHEVGDQVEGERKVRDQGADEELVSPREPPIAQEPREQHHAVGNEPGERARLLPPTSLLAD